MFRSVWFAVFLLAATLSAACSDSVAAPTSTTQAATQSVTDGVWRLQSFQRADSTVVPVPDPDRFTVEVSADGRLAVRADCNRCSASYTTQSSGTLRVNAVMACTKAFCSTAPFDTQFAFALSDATLVRATDTALEFVSAAGVLKFTR